MNLRNLAALALALTFASPALAQTPEAPAAAPATAVAAPAAVAPAVAPTALAVIQNVYNRPAPKDQAGTLTMTLTNRSGKTRVRTIEQLTKDFGAEEKKVMFFTAPADVKNTSFMSWSYDKAGKADDQWIYLPALKKVKRISSDSKSDYFMGSDFTYDDLGDRQPTSDTHTFLAEEQIDGQDCWVIESTPKDADYMYGRTVTWVLKGQLIGKKKTFYDEDGELLKTLEVQKSEQRGGYWIITSSQMKNHQKNHTTTMELANVKVDKGVSNKKFTERMMKRGL